MFLYFFTRRQCDLFLTALSSMDLRNKSKNHN